MSKKKLFFIILGTFILGAAIAVGIMFCVGGKHAGIWKDKPADNPASEAGTAISGTKDLDDTVKIAIISFNPEPREKEKNISELAAYIESACAAGAKIIVAPEIVTDDYLTGTEIVLRYTGVRDVETEFAQVCAVADEYDAYVCFGYPEIASGEHLYNSASIIGPDGNEILKTRKRSVPNWNERGNLEPAICATQYGNIGIIICADAAIASYVEDVCKLGADIILSPATWYGNAEQFDIWRARASENEVWYIAGNRWGTERLDSDKGYIDMSDAPSAVIDPEGNIVLSYTEGTTERDCIVYYDLPLN